MNYKTETLISAITIDDEDVPIEIDFVYYPPERGARDSLGGKTGAGPPLEPDTPADMEVTAVRYILKDATLILNPTQEQYVERLVWEYIDDCK